MPRINTGDLCRERFASRKLFHSSNAATSWPHARARHISIQIIFAFKIHASGLVNVLFVCNLYLPANAQLTRTQQEKRVAGISFLEVPDVMTSGNKQQLKLDRALSNCLLAMSRCVRALVFTVIKEDISVNKQLNQLSHKG